MGNPFQPFIRDMSALAKLLDWLAASHHADAIAAVRRAHIRHGGDGALYLVMKRPR